MIKLKSILIASTLVFATSVFSKANLPPPIEAFVKLEKMAGDAGPFVTKENFPQDYFLMSKNLPFFVGLILYHPSSSQLELSYEQIKKISAMKKEITPNVAKIAIKIKKLELEIVNETSITHKPANLKELDKKVDEIAILRSDLTKAHLRCIEKVKTILTQEQFEELLDYGVVNMF